MNVGRMIQYHRKKAGLSRIELARLAGLGKTIVYDLEHGRQTVQFNNLLSICHILNIKLNFSSPYMKEFEKRENSHES